MRKHLILATLIGLCAISVTACQRGENKPAAPTGTTAEQTSPANPGSETLNTASNNPSDQNQNQNQNNSQELAASNTNSPAGNNSMQANQNATQTADASSTAPAATDQNSMG